MLAHTCSRSPRDARFRGQSNFKLTCFKVPSKQVLWPRCKFRRASVNSFGLGGANTHVILEQAPLKRAANSEGNIANGTPANKLITNGQAANGVIKLQYSPAASQIESDRTRASHSDKARYLFVFSAADETSAKVQVASLCQYLKERHEIMYRSLYERLAFTLQRRTQLQWRFALTATCQEKLLERMEETKLRPVRTTRSPRLGFVFTGQGAQWYVYYNKINFFDQVLTIVQVRHGSGAEICVSCLRKSYR